MADLADPVGSLGGRVIYQKKGKLVQVFSVPSQFLSDFLSNSKVSGNPSKTNLGALFADDNAQEQVNFEQDNWLLLVKNSPTALRKAKKQFKTEVQRTTKFFEKRYTISSRPKRKKRAIDFFQSQFHKEYPDRGKVPFHIISTKGREVWSKMSDAEKAPYMIKADEDRVRFEQEEIKWKQNNRQPPECPKSAYATFVQDQKNKGNENKSWKSLSDEAKNTYRQMAEQDKKRYSQEMQEFKTWQEQYNENILASF